MSGCFLSLVFLLSSIWKSHFILRRYFYLLFSSSPVYRITELFINFIGLHSCIATSFKLNVCLNRDFQIDPSKLQV